MADREFEVVRNNMSFIVWSNTFDNAALKAWQEAGWTDGRLLVIRGRTQIAYEIVNGKLRRIPSE